MGSELPERGSPRRSARPPGGKAVGIALTPGPGRAAALAIVGVPLAILMIIGLKTADWGGELFGLPSQIVGLWLGSPNGGQGPNGFASPEPTATTDDPASPGHSVVSAPPDAGETVRKAYRAINRHDYQVAYSLGLHTSGQSYPRFVARYRGTARVTLTDVSVLGDTVDVEGTTTERDGLQQEFWGSYTVTDGHIASVQIDQGF